MKDLFDIRDEAQKRGGPDYSGEPKGQYERLFREPTADEILREPVMEFEGMRAGSGITLDRYSPCLRSPDASHHREPSKTMPIKPKCMHCGFFITRW